MRIEETRSVYQKLSISWLIGRAIWLKPTFLPSNLIPNPKPSPIKPSSNNRIIGI
jgi:hypothetical protein